MPEFDLNTVTGLSQQLVAERLRLDGYNVLPVTEQRGLFGLANFMRRPPRDPKERLIDRRTLALSFLQGLGVLAILVAMYGISLKRGQGEVEARALAFTTLIIANLGQILTNRSWSQTMLSTLRSKNAALWWVVGGALIFLGLVLYVPVLRELFRFAQLHVDDSTLTVF